MSDLTNERESLDEGLGSAFWTWFTAHVEREWGTAGERYQHAVTNAAEMKDDNAVHTLRMVLFAQKEIRRLLLAPAERLNQIKAQLVHPAERSTSRRGPGL